MLAFRRLLRRAPVGAALLATVPAVLAAQAPAFRHAAPAPPAVPTTRATPVRP